jgi:hypothetical protein
MLRTSGPQPPAPLRLAPESMSRMTLVLEQGQVPYAVDLSGIVEHCLIDVGRKVES